MDNIKSEVEARSLGLQWKIVAFCAAAVIGNVALHEFINYVEIPLFLDTVFTVAVCFGAGLLPGLLTGVLFTPLVFCLIYKFIFLNPLQSILIGNIFAICTILELLLVWIFHRKMKERESAFLAQPSFNSFTSLAPLLFLLVALDCVIISISGGIIGFTLSAFRAPQTFFPEDAFVLGLLRNKVPLLTSSILSRIPINIVDRFIVIFGGYGISLLYRRITK